MDITHAADKTLASLRPEAPGALDLGEIGHASAILHRLARHFLGAEQAFEKLLAREQRARIDPGFAAGPALDVGRGKQVLSEAGRHNGKGQHVTGLELKTAQRPHHQVDRRLDQAAARLGRPEGRRQQYPAQGGANVVAAVAKARGNAFYFALVGIGRDELTPQLAGDEFGRRRPGQQDVEYRIAIEVSGFSQHGLGAVIVHKRPPAVFAGFGVDRPAGKGARRLADIGFAVLALAHGEQLHHLTREVLVRLALAITGRIKVNDHRRVLGRGVQQSGEVAQRMLAQQHVLPVHQLHVFDFLLAGDKVVVPEQRHAFQQRRRRGDHFRKPPAAQLKAAPHLLLLECLARFFTGIAQLARRRNTLVHPHRCRLGRHAAGRPQQLFHRLLTRQLRKLGDFTRTGAKAGAIEQVPRLVKAHAGGAGATGVRKDEYTQAHHQAPVQDVSEQVFH